jgi:membrane protease YdiL (CAAX protease family)
MSSSASIRRFFVGPNGLRAGVRLVLYAALFLALFAINDGLRATVLKPLDGLVRFGIVEVLAILDLLLAGAVMARMERRRVGDYGLPSPRGRGGEVLRGLAIGFLWVSLSLGLMAAVGAYRVQRAGGEAGEIAISGAFYALLCVAIGVKEELYYRGYPLFTLATGWGFWPAAAVLSLWFGVQHVLMAHVTWLGGINIALGGVLFCLMIRGSGNLWMAIGAHAAIDWTEAFVYGVPVSGTTVPGALLHPLLPGPVWLSGGPAGPEGSILFTVAMLPVAWALWSWMRRRERSRSPHAGAR